MKKGLLLVALSAIFFSAQSQVNFGVKAGLNLSNFAGEDAVEAKMLLGPNLGAFVEIPVSSSFSVKPEVYYSAQGAKPNDDEEDVSSKLAFSYINVPILGKFTSESGFFAETGPQLGILASAKAKASGNGASGSVDIKEYFNAIDFAWAFGAGYQLSSGFGVNARYNLGISNLPKEDDAKMKNSVIQVGVFYNFGSASK